MYTDQLHRPDPAEGPLEGDRGGRGQPVVRLFTIPGSHPGVAAQLMLDHKGIPFKRTDLLPVVTWVVLKGLRFAGRCSGCSERTQLRFVATWRARGSASPTGSA
jgi:hypothetical protein